MIDTVKKLIDDNLSEKTRELLLLLPQMREELLYCLDYEQKIDSINKRLTDLQRLIA